MSDVARRAGVSIATVSNTLNRADIVSPQTRARVHRAIDELGFVRNAAASGLAAGASASIGIVIVDLENALFLRMVRGAESEAEQRGMKVLLTNSDIKLAKQDDSLRFFDEMRLAGIILAPLEGDLGAFYEVRNHGRPVVLLNHHGTDDACGVVVDEEHGGYLAARHLIDSGRTRLAFVGSADRYYVVAQRLAGARRAVAEASGVALELFETHGVALQHGHHVGGMLAERAANLRPDGIVAASDLVAAGLIQTMHRHNGIEIPRDIGIVGYDNNTFASDSSISVTTVAQPAEAMGREAFRLLMEEAHGSEDHRHHTVVLEPHLIERMSA